jgi:SAM-dependent methyltransferase
MSAKYDDIGKEYNATRKADPYILSRLLYHLRPTLEGRYLDIGCGTGNYTIEFDKKGFRFVGVDPSLHMLEKAQAENNRVQWQLGKAETLEFPAESFDGVVASLTLHHWEDLDCAFLRLYDLLKPEGRVVIFTATPAQMEGYWLRHYFPKMLWDSMALMPSMPVIKRVLSQSCFAITKLEPYTVQPSLEDLFLYSGKYDPEKYLDPKIRNGISSFRAVAHSEEVEKGLSKLKSDIDSGKIKEVMQSYENDGGDYLFVIAEKLE